MSAPPATPAYGEIYDRGYRHYDGEREGRLHAIWARARYSMARALGIKKGWTSKIIPILLYTGALLPVIIGIGISILHIKRGSILYITAPFVRIV